MHGNKRRIRILLGVFASTRQDLVDTPETKEGHEPSDNLTNALKHKDMVNYEHEDINDKSNHIGTVELPTSIHHLPHSLHPTIVKLALICVSLAPDKLAHSMLLPVQKITFISTMNKLQPASSNRNTFLW